MRYRKKPVEIEALQLKPDNIRAVYEFIYGEAKVNSFEAGERWDDYVRNIKVNGMKLMTLESDGQTQKADINDYIIKGVQGEFYPCKPDIFKLTYDKA